MKAATEVKEVTDAKAVEDKIEMSELERMQDVLRRLRDTKAVSAEKAKGVTERIAKVGGEPNKELKAVLDQIAAESK